jgi:hypothetical protein
VSTEQSTFTRMMDVEGDVEALKKLYDAKWVKCTKEVYQRVVSLVDCYFLHFPDSDIS